MLTERPLTRPAQRLLLPVDLPDRRREVHHAAGVLAVFEPEGVADLVDDLLADAVGEDVRRRSLAEPTIRRRLEAVRGDDAAATVEVGETEDVVPLSIEEVDGRDGHVLLPGAHPSGHLDERLRPVLSASRIVRVRRDVLSRGDRDVAVVHPAKPGGRLPLDGRGDVPDGDDVDTHANGYAVSAHKHPAVEAPLLADLVDALVGYDALVEVGIGRQTAVAAALAARGRDVRATDVHDRETPPGVAFVRDDVTRPRNGVYDGADAVYALNLPPELHRPAREVARDAGADLLFTTLGADLPEIPVERRAINGDTLFVAETR